MRMIVGRNEPALLEADNFQSRFRQAVRDDCAGRAGADDNDIDTIEPPHDQRPPASR